ncbi:MAG: ABC transporter permease subunit [Planctomycetaceae bacterium]|nr:ABC transporter permease subunit [Planctomycetaceae bacterium]MCB9953614.1 ABC transporter permease subunit [Planctomycetaceae bacterium]
MTKSVRGKLMRGLKRFATSILVLMVFGASAVTLSFYIVSLTDEQADDRLRMSDIPPPPPKPFASRYTLWVKTVIGSGLTDFGSSHTGPVKNVIANRLPVTATVGLLSWTLAWGLGLALAVSLATHWSEWAEFHQKRIYPIAHAVPSLVVVILFYLLLIQFNPRPDHFLRASVGIASLVVLMLPATTALWLNGIQRIMQQEYIRVARARGIAPIAVWWRHVLPNVVVSSGVLTQAVFSLAGLIVGSAFVEGVFRLGGVAEAFIEAATRGQAELAGVATLLYFLVLSTGVLLAEGLAIYLNPDGDHVHADS